MSISLRCSFLTELCAITARRITGIFPPVPVRGFPSTRNRRRDFIPFCGNTPATHNNDKKEEAYCLLFPLKILVYRAAAIFAVIPSEVEGSPNHIRTSGNSVRFLDSLWSLGMTAGRCASIGPYRVHFAIRNCSINWNSRVLLSGRGNRIGTVLTLIYLIYVSNNKRQKDTGRHFVKTGEFLPNRCWCLLFAPVIFIMLY